MNARFVRCAGLGAAALIGSLVACSGGNGGAQLSVSTSSNPANVSIALRDSSGSQIGSCAGTLITPTAVLTAGHCVVAASSFEVSAPLAPKTTSAKSTRAATFDWKDFESDLSHPMHSDLAVLILDRPIYLKAYPALAKQALSDGDSAIRLRRSVGGDGTFEEVTINAYRGKAKGFPLDYYTDMAMGETLDTGGGLFNASGTTIYGVVSGKGKTTGELYVTRLDNLFRWVEDTTQCASPPPQLQCHPKDGGSCGNGGAGGGGGSGGSGGDDGGAPPCGPPGGNGGSGGNGGDNGGGGYGGNGGENGGGAGGSGGTGECDGGGTDCPPDPPPDGPGCSGPLCGGCGSDPSCFDNNVDYGDCGCQGGGNTPPGPVPR